MTPTLFHRIAWPFLVFAVAGSLALALWVQAQDQRGSRELFQALARTNADFIRSAHLPATEQMMRNLGRLLNLRAYLVDERGTVTPAAPEPLQTALLALRPTGSVEMLGGGMEAIASPIDGGRRLALVRPAAPSFAFLQRPETALALGGFWLLSVALAWAITRGVVRPLRELAERLPGIEQDSTARVPGIERQDEIGAVARAYAAARDQAREERRQRAKSERHALLGRMATGLAHEIHNPLSAIRMHAQLLDSAKNGELESILPGSIPILLNETTRIESLVNQWMFLAKPAPPIVATVDLAPPLRSLVETYRAAAEHARVQIRLTCGDRGLHATADSRRILQAITNVLVNGIQAMREGGELQIDGSVEGDAIVIQFQDSGPGFSEEALSRYRELFFSQKEGGMGIGLSVACEIVEAHGGQLEVENRAGGGARATITLPRCPISES